MAIATVSKDISKILKKSGIKKTVIIDIRSMNDKFLQIKEYLDDYDLLKIFYGGSKEVFDNMVETFKLKGRQDLTYIGVVPLIRKITSYYWCHWHKF